MNRKLQAIENKKCAYDFPGTAYGWKKMLNPVYNTAESYSVFDPFVLKYNDEFRMYVSERKNHGIDVCTSLDGKKWMFKAKALFPNENTGWEFMVNRASVCRVENKWYIWYTGQKEGESNIGIAVSDDGYTFRRVKENPVITPELYFEKNSVMNPCVIWDEEEMIFKMWYAAGEIYEPDVLCYAESKDGLVWEKLSYPILEKSENKYDCCKVGGCDVKKLSHTEYVMFYIGYQNVDTARICMAVSDDGKNWTRSKNNPIISPQKGSWDQDAVYKPSAIYNSKWCVWYNGRRKNREFIGYAEEVKCEN